MQTFVVTVVVSIVIFAMCEVVLRLLARRSAEKIIRKIRGM